MHTPNIGQLITEADAARDAIHVAIAPMVAAGKLHPGDHVNAKGDPNDGPFVGIVDPFLKRTVRKGDRFWMFLYPGTVTILRHEWTHPALPAVEAVPAGGVVAESVEWITELAERCGTNYEAFIEQAKRHNETGGDWFLCQGFDTPVHDREEFWRHFEIATGIKAEDKDTSFVACSC